MVSEFEGEVIGPEVIGAEDVRGSGFRVGEVEGDKLGSEAIGELVSATVGSGWDDSDVGLGTALLPAFITFTMRLDYIER